MLLADTLVVLGLATASLGTINEADGVQQRRFLVRNDGTDAVQLHQGYTSCGCTTVHFDTLRTIAPGDTTVVTLRFNPRGKGGAFYETATIVYGDSRRLQLALEGDCLTSEETLLRQFPIRINDDLRLSADRFDLGYMNVGETRERHVTILHRDQQNRREAIVVSFTATTDLGPGLHHITRRLTTQSRGHEVSLTVTFDVVIR